MPFVLAKYNTQTTIYFPMVKRGVVDLAVTADWTPAASDTNVSKDGAAQAQATNTVAIAAGTTWKLTLTATELSAAEITVMVVDAATKAVEDQWLTVYTYGNASAKLQADFSDAVRLGLTALPNVASGSAGALPTTGTGANQLNVTGGRADADVLRWNASAVATPNVAGVPLVDLKYTLGTISPATAGSVRADSVTAGVTVTTNNDKTAYALTVAEENAIRDAIFARAFSAAYGALTFDQIVKVCVAALAAKCSGMATTTGTFRNLADSADVIVATIDANGNRTAVTVTP